jgi:hypothetical protein
MSEGIIYVWTCKDSSDIFFNLQIYSILEFVESADKNG